MSKMMRNYLIGLSIAIVIYAPVVSWLTIRKIIVPPELIDTMILFILASATIFYALRTSDIAEATKEQAEATRDQADASITMAEEMKKQRYDTVRPVIDIYRDPTDEDKMSEALAAIKGDASQGLSCTLCNVGLGPAIDLYSFVQKSSGSQRYDCGTLAVGEKTPRMKLSTINEINKDHPSDLLLVALYRDVYDRDFISSREVSVDKGRKGAWSIGSLQIREITEEE